MATLGLLDAFASQRGAREAGFNDSAAPAFQPSAQRGDLGRAPDFVGPFDDDQLAADFPVAVQVTRRIAIKAQRFHAEDLSSLPRRRCRGKNFLTIERI